MYLWWNFQSHQEDLDARELLFLNEIWTSKSIHRLNIH